MFKLRKLEDRIVLDAAIGQDIDDFMDWQDATVEVEDLDTSEPLYPNHVLVISSDIQDAEDLAAAANDDVLVIQYDAEETSLEEISGTILEALNGRTVESIAIASHNAGNGNVELSLTRTDSTTAETLVVDQAQIEFWEAIGAAVSEDGRIDLLACNVAVGEAGEDFVDLLSDVAGVEVAASSDLTGNPEYGGDWLLEEGGVDAAAVYFGDGLEDFDNVMLPTQIDQGFPTMHYGHAGQSFGLSLATSDPNAFSDPEEESIYYYLMAGVPSWVSGWDSATGTFSGTPNADDAGTSTVTIAGWDLNSPTWAEAPLTIRINRGPEAAVPITPETAVEDELFTWTMPASAFTDPDGDTLSYYLVSIPSWISNWDSSTGTMTGTPGQEQVGTNTVEIQAWDGINAWDGSYLVDTQTFILDVIPTNDPPELADGGTMTLEYTEGTGPQVLTGTITVDDQDSTMIQGATATISGGYVSTEDILSFTTTTNISGGWNEAMGSLVLTGTATLAEYQAALQTITYENTSNTPDLTSRTVEITVQDVHDGGTNHLVSDPPLSYMINLTEVPSAPEITAGGTLAFTEGDLATAMDNTITVTDAENDNVASATVVISGGYVNGEDVLAYAGGLTAGWDAATGTLTLTGSDTPANYQAALRSVTYANASDNPSTAQRTISWTVSDGAASSSTVASTVSVAAINDPPVMTGGTTLTFTEGDAQAPIDGTIAITDLDDTEIQSATVQITVNLAPGEDVLSFANTTTITGVWDPALGLLQLTGNGASIADFEAALANVSYMNTSNNPSTLARTVEYTVNDGTDPSNTISSTINVVAVNDAPIVTGGNSIVYTEGEPAKILDPGAILTDSDEPAGGWVAGNHVTLQITSADPTIVTADDVLSFAGLGGITGAWDGASSTLTLSGAGTVAEYEDAIRNVRYENTSATDPIPGTREVIIIADDGEAANNTSAPDSSWVEVVAVNDVPVLAGGGVELAYTEGDPATAVGGGFTITDDDNTMIQRATVTVNGYVNPDDLEHLLSFTGTASITGAWNEILGVLTLVGDATLAEYQTALADVMYENTNAIDPIAETLTLNYSVYDGLDWSNVISNTVRIDNLNEAPEVTVGGPLDYTENQGPVALDETVAVVDGDNANLQSATIRITGYDGVDSGDLLTFVDTASITSLWNSFSHMLTLTGDATLAEWETALRSIQYENTSEAPDTVARNVEFIVSDGTDPSLPATLVINVTDVNDVPEVTAGTAVTYVENDTADPMDVDPGDIITVIDADHANLQSATVRIADGTFESLEDVLDAPGAPGGIMVTWTAASGILSLSGDAPVADYQTALQSVTYANMDPENPTEGDRVLRFTVSDGLDFSLQVDGTVTVERVNDAPDVTAGGSLDYTEGDPITPIDEGILVYDVDSTEFTSATVRITGGYLEGEDRLSFAAMGAITGEFNATEGTMTLTGVDTLANWRAALRAVSYDNLAGDNPTVQQRVATYILNDGTNDSVPVTSTINIIPVNSAPVVTAGAATVYNEGDVPVALDGTVTVTDVDDTMIESAEVRITSGTFANTEDVLAFAGFGAVTFNAYAGGILTMSGTATLADYQTALRMVTYENTNDINPTTGIREIRWTANDGDADSFEAISTVEVMPVNDAPTMTAPTSDQVYLEESPPVPVDPDASVTIADVDDTEMESAVVQITGGYESAEDVLEFPGAMNIVGTWDEATGSMNLVGTATIAEYQAAIRSVEYVNLTVGLDPVVGPRTISYTVNDGDADSTPVTNIVDVQAGNDPPTVTLSGATLDYVENDVATFIDPAITVTDSDSTEMAGATITITNGSAGDMLAFTPTALIGSAWDPATYSLVLTGVTTIANWEAALSSVTYENTGDAPDETPRTVEFVLDDGGAVNNLSDPVVSTVNVTAVNDLPEVTPSSGGAASWAESGGVAVAIDTNASMTVTDPDDASIDAYAQISAATYQSDQDELVAGAGSITGTWDPLTGTMTFTGTAAEIQTAFQVLQYDNSAGTASFEGTREIEFWASDAEGDSAVVVGAVNVVNDVNTAPTVTPNAAGLTYTEASGAMQVDDSLTITAPDSATVTGATIQITAGYNMLEDTLSFANTATITGAFSAATGTLTLTGEDTVDNYAAALRNVRYENSNTEMPDGTQRTVTFTVTDDGGDNGANTRTIDIAYVSNNMHTLSMGGVLNYTEGDAATAVDADPAPVADPDGVAPAAVIDMYDLTVTITSGYEDNSAATYPAEDILGCATPGGLGAVTWDGATQTLSFASDANLTDINAAIASVTYISGDGGGAPSVNPSDGLRVLEFSVVNTETGETATDTAEVNVTSVNSLPVLAGAPAGIAAYDAGDGQVVIDGGGVLTATDADDDMIESAVISFSAGYVNGEDVLAFGGAGAISMGSWNPVTGELTLTGMDTLANYDAALRAVTYENLETMTPTNGARTVDFVVNDGTDDSNTIQATVTVAAVNDAPTVSAPTLPLDYTEGDPATPIDPSGNSIVIADPDNDMMSGATVTISVNYQNDPATPLGQDILAMAPIGNIMASWDVGAGVLTLSGVDTLDNYEAALSSITFLNNGPYPNEAATAGPRTLDIVVIDELGLPSLANPPADQQTITIIPVNSAPVLGDAGGGLTGAFTEAAGAVPVDGGTQLTLTDADDVDIESAVVQIVGGYEAGQDVLAGGGGAITSVWDDMTGTLYLNGTDTLVNYLAALQAVTFDNPSTNPDPTDRYVTFQVNDGDEDSNMMTARVTVATVENQPVLTTTVANLAYNEDDGPVAVDTGITLTDADNGMIQSATVQITGSFDVTEDVLALPAPVGNITGMWLAGPGMLQLTGTDTIANYELALQSVTYENTDTGYPSNPLPATPGRVVTFDVVDETGLATAAPPVRNIDITTISNNMHELTVGGTVTYNEATAAPGTILDATADLADLDVDDVYDITVQITGGYENNPVGPLPSYADVDTLVSQVSGAYGAGVWDGAGTLTIAAPAAPGALADVVGALQSVSYYSDDGGGGASVAPTEGIREITWTVTNPATGEMITGMSYVDVVATNDAPVLTVAAGPAVWDEAVGTAVVLDAGANVTDTDSDITGATITIGNFIAGEDELQYNGAGGLGSTWDPVNGVLTLMGTATAADYSAAFAVVSYQNLAGANPTAGTRNITWEVTDGDLADNTASTVTVTAAESAPVIMAPAAPMNWTEGDGPQPIDPAMTTSLTDPENDMIEGATVSIVALVQGDRLEFTPQGNVTGWYNGGTGILTLQGDDTPEVYQSVLQSITYENTSADPTEQGANVARTLTYTVTDDTPLPNVANNPVDQLVINVAHVNSTPELTPTTAPTPVFTEGGAAVDLDPNDSLTITDDDDVFAWENISGATVQFVGTYSPTDDDLVLPGGLGAWTVDTANGIATLFAAGTLANWEAELQGIQYQNLNLDNPVDGPREIEITVYDDEFATSAPISLLVDVVAVNDLPEVDMSDAPLAYTEGDGAVELDPAALVTDVDSTIAGATVTFTPLSYVAGEDVLAFAGLGAINGTWDQFTGQLTLTGTAPVADYQAAIQSVTYENTSDSPDTATVRTVEIVVTDSDGGVSAGVDIDIDVNVADVNDPPVLTAGGHLNFTEGMAATALDSGMTLTDVDGNALDSYNGATVVIDISGSPDANDQLQAVANALVGEAGSGGQTVTLTGLADATVADLEAALQSVTFNNASDAPVEGVRTVTITVDDGSGPVSDTMTVEVFAVNDAPTIGMIAAGPAFVEDGGPVAASMGMSMLGDADDTLLQEMTVQITGGYQEGSDELAYTGGILNPTWDPATGTLTLTGPALVADFMNTPALITFDNTSQAPDETPRTLSWQINDGHAENNLSNVFTTTLDVTAVNDLPVVTPSGVALEYTEGDPATPFDAGILVEDVDNAELVSATVQITAGPYQPGEDVLAHAGMGSIATAWDNLTGTLYLDGVASVADYQQVLSEITYENVDAIDPMGGTRTVTIIVNDGTDPSAAVTSDINVTLLDDAPVVTAGATLAYTENDPAAALDTTVTVTDTDSTTLTMARVWIDANYDMGNDVLALPAAVGPINGAFNAGTGMLTLSGAGTVFEYQQALRSITFENTSDAPGNLDRTIAWQVNDGTSDSLISYSTVAVTPVNDAPTAPFHIFYIDENSAGGQAVNTQSNMMGADGAVLGSDPDGTITYGIIDPNNMFDIDPVSGVITYNGTGSLDFETQDVYVINAELNDGTDTTTSMVVIQLNDLAEAPLRDYNLDQGIADETHGTAAFGFQFAENAFEAPDAGHTVEYTAFDTASGSMPTWLSFDGPTRAFWSTAPQAGAVTIQVEANYYDGGVWQDTVTTTFQLTVAALDMELLEALEELDQQAVEEAALPEEGEVVEVQEMMVAAVADDTQAQAVNEAMALLDEAGATEKTLREDSGAVA